MITTVGTTTKLRNLRRSPRASLRIADDAPPFAYVEARSEVSLSEHPDELLDVATRAGARCMDAAEAFGKRNAAPGGVIDWPEPPGSHNRTSRRRRGHLSRTA